MISAAYALLDEGGPDAVTHRAVADRSSLALGSVSYRVAGWGPLRDHLWQRVEIECAETILGAPDLDQVVQRLTSWAASFPNRARFYCDHAPDPGRPLQLQFLSKVPNSSSDPEVLEANRHFLQYLSRRLQATVEYVLTEPDQASMRNELARELHHQGMLWDDFAARTKGTAAAVVVGDGIPSKD